MRHRVQKTFRFNHKDTDHRQAVIRNLLTSFFIHKSIVTTEKRARALQIMAQKLVNIANEKDKMNAIRKTWKYLFTKESSLELFNNVAPKYSDKKSGITRITAIKFREGDCAKLVKIELV